jgi:outer membrane protein assembly factor BamB
MNASRFFVALGIIICLVLSPVIALVPADTARAQPADSPWPMFGQNAQHTHRSPYSGPEIPKLKWSFTTGFWVHGSPTIGVDGTIYFGSDDNKLYAMNPDGTEKWSFATGGYVRSSPAIGADGTIYVGSWDGNLYAMNPDGSQKWTFPTGGTVYSSQAIGADGTIYVGASYLGPSDGHLYALNADGSQKWSFTTADDVCSSPAIAADSTIYVGCPDGELYAINPDGSQKWIFAAGGAICSGAAIGADGTIYFGCIDGKLYAINPNGSQKWSFPTGDWINSSPAIGADGTIYIGSDDDNLYAVNPNGSQKWSFATGDSVWSSPAIGADGTIYVGSLDDNLYAINPDGSQKWSFPAGTWGVPSSPAIGADGTIYVGADYKLCAITEEFDLTISSTAGGSVTAPGVGTFTYDRGTVVNLVAQAEEGYRFVEWARDVETVADVDAASTTITMNGDYSITANFEQIPPQFDLTISSTTGGSVTAPGEGTFPYEEGTGVNLVAEAEEGYRFVNWTGHVDTIADADAASTSITVNGDYSITANFEVAPSDGGCFIATAAYGTPMAEEIEILREFRDGYLLTNSLGQALVDIYYEMSPPMAEFITEHSSLKPIVRAGLLPAVAMSAVTVNTSPAEKMAIIGFLVLASVAVAVWLARRRGRGPEYLQP